MKKIIVAGLLAAAFSIVSCGGNADSQNDDSDKINNSDTNDPDKGSLDDGAGTDTLFKSKSENADTVKMNQDGTKEEKAGQ
ncbi:hypothetical protein LJ707_04860 [Mucilaginibacter sp. UR6-1]|uniref:hypothetical protein n=1 Tax=Mucilaginibacter sp. UR6-1 TaxID=1435643 RepID=UPI001E35397E|nr:hypothetical protein [Mucilaginibacter sp. UR6-1]MCC8408249.1 hypothetical protein [Mucilaginibacter sp. UR6-1]